MNTKKSLYILFITILGLQLSCSNFDHKKDGYNESNYPVAKPENDKEEILVTSGTDVNSDLINIDKGLKEQFGDYLIEFHDGILSLCCFDPLAYPFGSNTKEQIKKYCITCADTMYHVESNGERYDRDKIYNEFIDLTIFSFFHEDGYIEYYLEDSSYFKDPSIILDNGLKIGMTKREIFNKYFTSSNEAIYQNLKIIAVCPDERGELYTQYWFQNDTLNAIRYGFDIYHINTSE